MQWAAHLSRALFGHAITNYFLLLFRSRSCIYSGRMKQYPEHTHAYSNQYFPTRYGGKRCLAEPTT
jgi:hypothetical protein